MEGPDFSPPSHVDASRPSLGFPLGTALLLIIIFSLSGIFSCCYHWEKLRSLRRSFADDPDLQSDIESSPSKPKQSNTDMKQSQKLSVPVLMPGDQIPTFIALPCPCEPPRAGGGGGGGGAEEEKVVVKIEKPPTKPPRIPAPLF